MNRRLAEQVADDVPALCQAPGAQLGRGMLAADPGAIGAVAAEHAAARGHSLREPARDNGLR